MKDKGFKLVDPVLLEPLPDEPGRVRLKSHVECLGCHFVSSLGEVVNAVDGMLVCSCPVCGDVVSKVPIPEGCELTDPMKVVLHKGGSE